jgi:hypothetical protein
MTVEIECVARKRALRKLGHEIIVPTGHSRGASAWCEEQFGTRWNVIDNRDGAWAMFWAGVDMAQHYRFCFAEERDAMLFSLRWL